MVDRETKKQTRKRKKIHQTICSTPIQVPALNSSYSDKVKPGDDFYMWVNEKWETSTEVPPFENDFSVSEEVERCIFKKSIEIIESEHAPQFLKDLKTSCLNDDVQAHSVEFLKSILQTVQEIQTKDDVFFHFAQLWKYGFKSIFNLQYHNEPDKKISLCIDVDSPGLNISYHMDNNISKYYKEFLKKMETMYNIPDISKSYNIEKNIILASNNYYNDTKHKIKGYLLERKFSKIPWKLWFDTIGISEWRKMDLYYTSPRWIRYIGKTIHEVPISYWKVFLARCYIIETSNYLPYPYSDLNFEFFGKFLEGQKDKFPKKELLVKIVHNCLHNEFSKLFWDYNRNDTLVDEIYDFSKTLVNAAKYRIKTTEWLKEDTRNSAVKKVSYMNFQTVKPGHWPPSQEINMDPTNFIKNILKLGELHTDFFISQIGKVYKYWEEGIYRVNAYYFNENNELIIPYGTCVEPFYIQSHQSWNYGGLGSIIGHELCHGFDKEGKEYNENGNKERWWTRSDNIAYNHKTKDLIKLYSKQIIEGTHVDGIRTLSENIADLGGVGISLQALKDYMIKNHIKDVKKEYKKFFISFATSWRTKYRNRKLKSSLLIDSHSPAFLRVNLVVSQFDEWYEAFDIHSDSKLYIAPEHRIRIF